MEGRHGHVPSMGLLGSKRRRIATAFFGHTYATVSVLAPIPVVAALLYCVELPTALMTPQQECYYVEPTLTLGGFFPPSVAT